MSVLILDKQYEEYLQQKEEIERLNKALLDIKEYIEKEKERNLVKEEYEIPGYMRKDILDIVNKASGSDKE